MLSTLGLPWKNPFLFTEHSNLISSTRNPTAKREHQFSTAVLNISLSFYLHFLAAHSVSPVVLSVQCHGSG